MPTDITGAVIRKYNEDGFCISVNFTLTKQFVQRHFHARALCRAGGALESLRSGLHSPCSKAITSLVGHLPQQGQETLYESCASCLPSHVSLSNTFNALSLSCVHTISFFSQHSQACFRCQMVHLPKHIIFYCTANGI